ncbi:acyl-CoA dehydrogenase, N-terminal domain protein [Mycolicibacterium hassiacum DSM 44199]|jgi:alkylation response protein AidB-like acyl-CoA dehydrogenase|uniref:Acyl-CoA dehydrogenase, N-terminal domain protein n=1 Tax=Mycolicibacterium hassiacum (strain DSM 44199 / CIP 105218 / JCM 12690 / 3849) TaxID=1122247 RepID=K5BG43_MYCHD|nr:acyl-CoA dehydrogenase family protein [Mycolicibacterium hassiacum]EKF24452.1 acyl-CoA dehydrogenase, N-terminal domain protein [Mycolicibacterium hassiacum DSM 44199]MBX5486437.1 acyl-CoA dehydrogenase family protein [Mycolicibacterium hassiacum]MDA4084972.1 acyl-CoA dehydrogenase [Mycolicibacterium hassiacum DSM 44199]VCT89112.1 Putative acyl-CoA dehydrogenase FadE17 [Mycolicibacterium hassiacum DSM 44199]
MELTWSEADIAFRDEVRRFLDEKLTPDLRRAGRLMTSVYADHEASLKWQRILHERGWAAPAWPVEYGGCDWTLTQHYIFNRECTLAGAPSLSPMGIKMVAHALIAFGTKEQKDYFLPRILTGEVFFCQGYSEPEAGSDLAALSMAAVDDGDHLVCTGSKIWTTHAREANWMFALVRTSRTAKKQQGITFLLIDMTSPGIEIRPLVMTSGEEVQNQVFFDHVRVPKSNVVGRIDEGWAVAKYLLEFERGGTAYSPALQVMAENIAAVAAEQPGPLGGRLLDDPAFARKLADARIRTEVLEILEYRILAGVAEGRNPGPASSMLKVLGTELSQTLTELAMEAAGPRGRVYQPHATAPGGPVADYQPPPDGYVSGEPWQAVAPLRYLNDRAGSIYAGSNEIQRNILAKAALGL